MPPLMYLRDMCFGCGPAAQQTSRVLGHGIGPRFSQFGKFLVPQLPSAFRAFGKTHKETLRKPQFSRANVVCVHRCLDNIALEERKWNPVCPGNTNRRGSDSARLSC